MYKFVHPFVRYLTNGLICGRPIIARKAKENERQGGLKKGLPMLAPAKKTRNVEAYHCPEDGRAGR